MVTQVYMSKLTKLGTLITCSFLHASYTSIKNRGGSQKNTFSGSIHVGFWKVGSRVPVGWVRTVGDEVLRSRRENQERNGDRRDFRVPLCEGQLCLEWWETRYGGGVWRLWTLFWTLCSQSSNRAMVFLERALPRWCCGWGAVFHLIRCTVSLRKYRFGGAGHPLSSAPTWISTQLNAPLLSLNICVLLPKGIEEVALYWGQLFSSQGTETRARVF